jgi:hypothetical protein
MMESITRKRKVNSSDRMDKIEKGNNNNETDSFRILELFHKLLKFNFNEIEDEEEK